MLKILIFCLFLSIAACEQASSVRQHVPRVDDGVGAAPLRSPEPVRVAESRLLTPEQARVEHNSRVARISSICLRGDIQFDYYDPKGRRCSEHAEGALHFRRPQTTAMFVYVADQLVFYMAANPEYFWYFDPGSKTAWIGRSVNAKGPFEQEALACMHPLDVMDASGLIEIPPEAHASSSTTTYVNGSGQEIALCTFLVNGTRTDRLLSLDLAEGLVRVLEVRNKAGRVLGVCRLGGYRSLIPASPTPVPTPLAPTFLEVNSVLFNAKLSIQAKYAGEAPPNATEIRESNFDFEAMLSSIPTDSLVVIDEKSDKPALSPQQAKDVLERCTTAKLRR